jgi:hypothetical protein
MSGNPRTLLATLPVVILLAAITGCAGGADVDVRPVGGAAGPACIAEATGTVCVSAPAAGSSQSPSESSPESSSASTGPSTPAVSPTSPTSGQPWGGGQRVGDYRTVGTVTRQEGDGSPQSQAVTGRCDVTADVRTITVDLDPRRTLVIDVTGDGVASVTLDDTAGPTREAEYLGRDEVTKVVTLTRSRTVVRGAYLLPPVGQDAPVVRLDADVDC